MTGLRWLLAAVSLSLGPACVSNTIELETMPSSESAGDEGSSSGGGGGGGVPPSMTTVGTSTSTTTPADESDSAPPSTSGPALDIGGVPPTQEVLLLAVSTILEPDLPVQGIVWLERGGEGTVNLEFQWLSLEQGSTTEPRTLVGDVYAYEGIPVALDGTFVWSTGVILLPGAANPISGADVVLSMDVGVVPSGAPYCGSVGGEVTSPIELPLEGSTHAMTTVPSPDELPLDFPVSC